MRLEVLGLKLLSLRIRPLAAQLADTHADHSSTAGKNLRPLNILQAFGRESLKCEQVAPFNDRILHLERRQLIIVRGITPPMQKGGALLLIVVLCPRADQLSPRDLGPSEVISLLLLRSAGQLASGSGT